MVTHQFLKNDWLLTNLQKYFPAHEPVQQLVKLVGVLLDIQ
jgi:hypothetical protein